MRPKERETAAQFDVPAARFKQINTNRGRCTIINVLLLLLICTRGMSMLSWCAYFILFQNRYVLESLTQLGIYLDYIKKLLQFFSFFSKFTTIYTGFMQLNILLNWSVCHCVYGQYKSLYKIMVFFSLKLVFSLFIIQTIKNWFSLFGLKLFKYIDSLWFRHRKKNL